MAESDAARTNGAAENAVWFEAAGSGGAEADGGPATDGAASGECPDPCAEQTSCGQICLTLKGIGSSCQLVPTVNDLTRPPRSVHFDCGQLERGPNGYDFDALGHITLMGDTCEALTKSGPHHVTLNLSCPPS
jgi:hypothetical protein